MKVGSEAEGALTVDAETTGVQSSLFISSGCENIQSAARSTLLSVFLRALTHCERLKPIDCSIATPSSSGLKVPVKHWDQNFLKMSSNNSVNKNT